jgi:transposase
MNADKDRISLFRFSIRVHRRSSVANGLPPTFETRSKLDTFIKTESVMAKKANKRSNRYPVGFQRDAVARMKHCEDIGKLAEELGVSRGALYLWKRKGEGLLSYRDAARQGHPAAADNPQANKIRELEAKVAGLEGELGRRSLEASFFKSALRRVEGLRRRSEEHGGTASTTRSAAGSRKAN